MTEKGRVHREWGREREREEGRKRESGIYISVFIYSSYKHISQISSITALSGQRFSKWIKGERETGRAGVVRRSILLCWCVLCAISGHADLETVPKAASRILLSAASLHGPEQCTSCQRGRAGRKGEREREAQSRWGASGLSAVEDKRGGKRWVREERK